jgi:hypothetical protein
MIGGGLMSSGNKKAAGGLGAASGILGALGGGLGIISGIYDAVNAKDKDGKRDKAKTASGIMGALGGLVGLGGGIFSAISGVKQAKGKEVPEGVSKGSGILELVGGGLGALSSLFGFGGAKEDDKKLPAKA